jgi:hypothetical protein
MPDPSKKPVRVQLSRRTGWRMPADTINVARPSAWGNPFRIGDAAPDGDVITSREEAVRLYRLHVVEPPNGHDYEELRGKDLACWCPLDGPCHADVLMKRANRRR